MDFDVDEAPQYITDYVYHLRSCYLPVIGLAAQTTSKGKAQHGNLQVLWRIR